MTSTRTVAGNDRDGNLFWYLLSRGQFKHFSVLSENDQALQPRTTVKPLKLFFVQTLTEGGGSPHR